MPGNDDTTNSATFVANQVSIASTKPGCETSGYIAVGGVANGL